MIGLAYHYLSNTCNLYKGIHPLDWYTFERQIDKLKKNSATLTFDENINFSDLEKDKSTFEFAKKFNEMREKNIDTIISKEYFINQFRNVSSNIGFSTYIVMGAAFCGVRRRK